MKRVFKEYFSHKSIFAYISILLIVFTYCLQNGYFSEKWNGIFVLALVPVVEWLIHKYLLHKIYESNHAGYQHYLNTIHLYHHQTPRNLKYAFAADPFPLLVPLVFAAFFGLITWDLSFGLVVYVWAQAYFLYYEWIHLAHHVESYKPITKFGRKLKQAHSWHHYKNEDYWWGVTTLLGDDLLKTNPDVRAVKKGDSIFASKESEPLA